MLSANLAKERAKSSKPPAMLKIGKRLGHQNHRRIVLSLGQNGSCCCCCAQFWPQLPSTSYRPSFHPSSAPRLDLERKDRLERLVSRSVDPETARNRLAESDVTKERRTHRMSHDGPSMGAMSARLRRTSPF